MKTITLGIVTAIVAGVAFSTMTATGLWPKLNEDTTFSTQALTATEKSGLIGKVYYTLRDKDGNIKYETVVNNAIVDTGEDIIQRLFGGTLPSAFLSVVCVGTSTAVVGENTAGHVLTTPTTGGSTPDTCKTDASVTIGTQIGGTAQTVEVDATFTGGTDFAGPSTSVAEAVLADTDPAANAAPAAANTFARQTFTAIPVASGDSLTVKWTITISE